MGGIIGFMHYNVILQDSFRVVTASRDLSLRVLTWRNDRDSGLTLESRYHLLGGSHTMSRYCNRWLFSIFTVLKASMFSLITAGNY